MSEEIKCRNKVEDCIKKLVNKFRRDPSWVLEERNLHYSLHDFLCEYGGEYFTKLHKVRWEYPTNQKYVREKGKLTRSGDGRHGDFDLAIINRGNERIPVAIEFSFDHARYPIGRKNQKKLRSLKNFEIHVKNDFKKLTNEKNNVECGYILCFVRGEMGYKPGKKREMAAEAYRKKIEGYLSKLKEINSRPDVVKMLLVESGILDGQPRSPPEDWFK